ncbi:hypothetical protein RR46_14929 [Papilio xuthus]|uniref:Uncharacterized protein n=1 Tax=Papilio xuthus TaxID=66420 RepID=A0A194PK06_PAPXU|nr:hypothetical protein RR46_14929 [Papilio xuthus]
MFGFRTPDRRTDRAAASDSDRALSPRSDPSPGESQNERRNIENWELEREQTKDKSKAPVKRIILTKDPKAATRRVSFDSSSPPKYATKLAEARACVTKAKINLGLSRNTKTEIKEAVTQAVERLYLVRPHIDWAYCRQY